MIIFGSNLVAKIRTNEKKNATKFASGRKIVPGYRFKAITVMIALIEYGKTQVSVQVSKYFQDGSTSTLNKEQREITESKVV